MKVEMLDAPTIERFVGAHLNMYVRADEAPS